MTTANEMVRTGSAGLAQFEPRDFTELGRLAEMCAKSGLFAVKSPEAAMVVMLTGASLGLPPVAALRGIHVVQGKAVLSSDLLVAVVLRSGQCALWTPLEVTATRCVIETQRKGSPAPVRHAWTMDDAKRAKLSTKSGPWQEYPAAMLRARCSAELARMVYPDVLFGVFVEGEIESTGELVSDTRAEAPKPAPRDLALEAFAVDVEAADTARALRVCYFSLVEGLRAAGVATEDMAPALADGAAQIRGALDGLALHLSSAEMNALLATDGEALARALDTLLTVLRGAYDADMVARWWINVRADLARDVGGACYRVAQRALAADPADAASVRKAGEWLKRSIARLDQPPPTGTDAPAGGSNDGATAEATSAPAESTAAAHASRERIASAGGIRAYLRTKGSRRELELAVRAHGRHVPGLAQIAAERLDALTPADHDGTRPTAETLRRDCERWASEGPLARVLRAA